MIHKKITYVFALLSVALMLSGCEKARVDAQMEELCKQDGGMKIYEKVVLPREQFTQYGDVRFFETSNTGGGYRFIKKFEQLKLKKPTLDKTTYTVIREIDNKVLGTYVVYLRIGGDIIPRLGPDSGKSCPSNANSVNFLRTIFVQKN
ncbi:hypothetical protein [Herminiimonas aquatilis]|uniref:Uncharacterized protein n=1 Tax=Herminiimonas aquatilis TaxID=345342 RepID=A0ABW2J9F9_9BURK